MSKHRIPRSKAREMVDKFKKRRGQGPAKPLPLLPDGYVFEAKEVKELLDNPAAHYFIISLGISESQEKGKPKESISPILCVADSDYKILSGAAEATAASKSAFLDISGEAAALNADDNNDDDGGFLDESNPYPPPPIGP